MNNEQYVLMRTIDSIYNYVEYLINKKGNTFDLKAIVQWIRNISILFTFSEFQDTVITLGSTLAYRNRDSQMAENILWITENYPKEKFLVWSANFHGAKDISQTIYPNDSLAYFRHQVTGETLYYKLGNKFYSLAITWCPSNKLETKITGYLPNKFETSIHKKLATDEIAGIFIDFESLRFVDGFFDKEFECALINRQCGKWLYIFDGVYCIYN
jgi:erythromycin esterase